MDGDWHHHASALFGGEGSFGNGAAMRVAPLGAYFADDISQVVVQANRSAIVTHAHKEGRAGAITIALAAAHAWNCRGDTGRFRDSLYDICLQYTPESQVRAGIERAKGVPPTASVDLAANRLGNGREISAVDTVPFTLWCAHRHIDDFEMALWTTVSTLGDRDTTCAIVGGIVALSVGRRGLPPAWLVRREGLEEWIPG